jgi:hypothetical protein
MRILENYPRGRGYIFFLISLDVLFLIMFLIEPVYILLPGLRWDLLAFLFGSISATFYKYLYFKKLNAISERRDKPKKFRPIAERAWKYFSEHDKLLHDRINYFLVAESMLLFSFVAAYAISINDMSQIRPSIAFTGIIVTLIWFYANRRMRIRMRFFHDQIWKNDPLLFNWRMNEIISPTEEIMLTTLLPGIIFFLWQFLFAFSINMVMKNFMEFWLPISIFSYICLYFIIELTLSSDN